MTTPVILWGDVATWFSGVASFAAVAVALYLARAETRHRIEDERKRARAVATVFNENLGYVQTFTLAVCAYGKTLDKAPKVNLEIAHFSTAARALPPIVEDRFSDYLRDLPPDIERLVLLADFRFRAFREDHLFTLDSARGYSREAAAEFVRQVQFLREAVEPASRCTQELVAPGHPPAWEKLSR